MSHLLKLLEHAEAEIAGTFARDGNYN